MIKGSYKYLSQKWHPDKNPANREQAERNYKILQAAYDVLSEPTKRAAYDARLAALEADHSSTSKTHTRTAKDGGEQRRQEAEAQAMQEAEARRRREAETQRRQEAEAQRRREAEAQAMQEEAKEAARQAWARVMKRNAEYLEMTRSRPTAIFYFLTALLLAPFALGFLIAGWWITSAVFSLPVFWAIRTGQRYWC